MISAGEIQKILAIARRAGAAIMEIYGGEHQVETKADDTPVTAADKAAHRVIVASLQEATPEIPILSEEGADIPYAERRGWRRFWLVDPLDGTREFIKRNGEFTVNIALIEDCRAVLGVIYAPALDRLYWGGDDIGAWLQGAGCEPRRLHVRRTEQAQGLTVVMSRSHPSPDLDEYLQTIDVAEILAVGSSLKLCALAEGKADLYPRLGPTMEWDNAAGQALVEAAGGQVRGLDGQPVRYNKPDLRHPWFVATATPP